ncbi:4-hydroxy-tetrahydrodipicolinate synthase [Candidatus Poribacteria bacterium]|nr:4-hydroxy-tetrahydrodipicolinate synthase [Candidatus Poribacteria bacterium]
MFTGSIVAIVTPFKNGKIDENAFRNLIEFHVKNGTNGIVPCGTTGESATLSYEEHKRIIDITIETVNKRIPVIAGAGSNNTEEALDLTRYAKKAGATGALLITPYYNKPTQQGLVKHFEKIALEVDIPIVLYNVPSRTGVNMLPATVEKLAKIDNIVAVKEATGDLKQCGEIINRCGDNIVVLSGDDFTVLPLLAIGGKGVISVVANITPLEMSNLISEFNKGNIKKSAEIHYKIFDLTNMLFIETNPIPVKTALALMGKISEEFRLPLCNMQEENKNKLREMLKSMNLL